MISFSNTCAFDTILELFTSAYRIISDFKRYIDEHKDPLKAFSCFSSLISEYSTSGANNTIYSFRCNLLYSLYPPDDNLNINCTDNISNVMGKLMDSYSCTIEETKCSLCGTETTKKKCSIDLPNLNIAFNNYLSLEKDLNNYFSKKVVMCTICNKYTVDIKYALGNYVWIDTEVAYQNSNTKFNAYGSKDLTTNLNNLPSKLTLQEENFFLIGVVQYQPPHESTKVGHYIAFCRYIDGHWIQKNDCCKSSKMFSKKVLPDIKIHALLYVKYSEL